MLQNKYRIVGEIVYISLTKEQETMIDVADLEKVLPMHWHATSHATGGYYAVTSIKNRPLYLHRFLIDAAKGTQVQHINRHTLDNRRSNLRLREKRGSHHLGYWIDGDIAFIQLTHDQVTMIDRNDLEKVLTRNWSAIQNVMGGYYAISAGPTYLHRFLLDAPQGKYVDHINHDTLCNRRSNLRIVTNQENNVNRDGAYNTSKTGIRGVSTHKCKPSGLMYVFKCSCVTCKACIYFPHTEEGLEDARKYAEAHYAAMQK